jgi:undecaprenyl-diphosphatase
MLELDSSLFRLLYDGDARGALVYAMLAFTALGSGWVGLLVIPFMVWPRARRPAIALAIAIAFQSIAVFGIKRLVARPRPWLALDLSPPRALPTDFSFPSGHATASFTVAAFLAALCASSTFRGRSAVAASALAIAGFIAVSRVVLGAHWPSDVLGGSVIGAAIGATAARAARV